MWVIRAGRGFGKTRAGAEWVTQLMRETPDGCFALVGATAEDVRKVMVEGPSGVIAVAAQHERPVWTATSGTVTWPNGATAQVYSAGAPEKLRGPEHHAAWCDELGKWGKGGEAAWDNLTLTLRLGERARVLVTTTPRATALMRRVLALPTAVETAGRTRRTRTCPTASWRRWRRSTGARGWGGRSWTASCWRTWRARCGRARCWSGSGWRRRPN